MFSVVLWGATGFIEEQWWSTDQIRVRISDWFGNSFGTAGLATFLVEVIVIMMARNLRMHAVERSRVKGKEEGKEELLSAQKDILKEKLESGEINQHTFNIAMAVLSSTEDEAFG